MASFLKEYYWVIIIVVVVLLGLTAIAAWMLRHFRKKTRYEYSALEEEAQIQDRLELERKYQKSALKGVGMINCQSYLRGSTRYVLVSQLNDIGSRIDKHWFLVRDATTKTERLMTMTPVVFKTCPFKASSNSPRILAELFLTLQHPYVYPVLDFDYKTLSDEPFSVVFMPFSEKGSLKDLLYHSNCQDDWTEKYRYHGEGLQINQIQRLGRQILEGLLFLHEKGYPSFGHLHSGNVIIQNGVARVSGLENPLLGHSPKIFSLAHKKLKENPEAIDAVCFGHLLFEMASGYELTRSHPTGKHFSDIAHMPQIVKVLKFVFNQDNSRYPSIQEISCLEFFRHIDLRELRVHSSLPVFQNKPSPVAKALLREIRKNSKQKRANKRSQSTSAIETTSISSQDSADNRSGKLQIRCGSQSTLTLNDPPIQSSLDEVDEGSLSFFVETDTQPVHPEFPYDGQVRTGSSHTVASLSNTSGSLEYYTPPDTPIHRRSFDCTSQRSAQRQQIIAEIKENRKFKKLVDIESPDL